ncbi:MAG: hypothetical protein WC516_04925 [Patescibacteria group bacterium]|jgi:hypothetical protein
MSERTYRFGEEVITAPEDLSIDQVRQVWEAVHPSLANAEAIQLEDGSVNFQVRAGTKGAERTYRFGEEVITAPEDLSIDQVRQVWEAVHPSLANAEAVQLEDGSVNFQVRAGTKGV